MKNIFKHTHVFIVGIILSSAFAGATAANSKMISNTIDELWVFVSGDTVLASKVNENFEYLESKIDAIDTGGSGSSGECSGCDASNGISKSLLIGSGAYADDLIFEIPPSAYTSSWSNGISLSKLTFDGDPPIESDSFLIYIRKPSGEEIPLGNGTRFIGSLYQPSEFDQVRIESDIAPDSVLITVGYKEYCDSCENVADMHFYTQTDSIYQSIRLIDNFKGEYRAFLDLWTIDEFGSIVPGTWTVICTLRATGQEMTTTSYSSYGTESLNIPFGCDMIAYFEDWSPGVTLMGRVRFW